jgi:hypothetical protein
LGQELGQFKTLRGAHAEEMGGVAEAARGAARVALKLSLQRLREAKGKKLKKGFILFFKNPEGGVGRCSGCTTTSMTPSRGWGRGEKNLASKCLTRRCMRWAGGGGGLTGLG